MGNANVYVYVYVYVLVWNSPIKWGSNVKIIIEVK